MDYPDHAESPRPESGISGPRVFISHSSRDKAAAVAVCHALEARGIRCWIASRDIQPGANWGEAILNAIGQCKVMVLLLSSSANASGQVLREVERAVNRSVAIIPVRIEEVTPAAALEYFLSASHWLDAFAAPFELHLRRIVGVVETFLGGGQPPSVPFTPPRAPVRKWSRPVAVIAVVLLVLWFLWSFPFSPPQPPVAAPRGLTPSEVHSPRVALADFVGDWEIGGALLKDMVMNWTSYEPIRFSVNASGAVTGQAALVREDRGDEMILHRPPILVSLTGTLRELSNAPAPSGQLSPVAEIELRFSDGTSGKGIADSSGSIDIALTKGEASCRARALRR